MGRLDGKSAIVTGGASGLGRAMALSFAREGATVLAADIDDEGVKRTAEIADEFARGSVQHMRLDVTSEDACSAAVKFATDRWGKLDVMVANAGIGLPGAIADLSKDDFERVLAVNLTGVFLCIKHAFIAMRSTGGGVILATASTAGLRGTPGLGSYGPSKAAVIQLVRTVALEGAPFNIRANALCPIWIKTPMVDAFMATMSVTEEVARARLVASIPLGRLGRPEDVAAAAVYLSSDEASFISGTAFQIDGAGLA